MNRLKFWRFTFLTGMILLFNFVFVNDTLSQRIEEKALDLLEEVDSVLRCSNGIEFKAELKARMKGEDYHQVALFKIQRVPLKIYYRQYERNQIELLYDETVNKKKALVNPAGFPYANLHLSPYSSLILKRQHHSIFEADPTYILEQVFYMFEQCNPDRCLISLSDTSINGVTLQKIYYKNTHYTIKQIHVQREMDLLQLADYYNVNFYSILFQNEDLDLGSSLKNGEMVKIPSSYAKSIELLIDPQKKQLHSILVEDHEGFFESYRYLWFRNNVVFSPLDFSTDNSEYNF